MKKALSFSFLFLFTTFIWAQDFEQIEGLLWVQLKSDEGIPITNQGGVTTINAQLNGIFSNRNVSSIDQVFPTSKNKSLQKVYAIKCDCDADLLKNELIPFDDIYSNIRRRNKPILAYDPEDSDWQEDADERFWHLKIIEADFAWEVTTGDPNIVIHVIDTGFDPTNPDLSTETIADFTAGGSFPCYSQDTPNQTFGDHHHSTGVSAFASGETTEIGEVSNGRYASVGFNTKLIVHDWANGLNEALVASQNGARIINISWFNDCNPDPTGTEQIVIQEILDNGTTIVAAAGNGAPHCNFGPIYPFSGVYDDRIIQVTSTGRQDQHGGNHSHYPEVDIAAPGIDGLWFAIPMVTCVQGNPTGGVASNGGGTSFSAPIVAGVAGLMLSVNPNLCNTEIQDIMKNTADPIIDEAQFSGLVGAGRINALHCVSEAKSRWEADIHDPITSNTTWSSDRFVNEELIVRTGTTLTITSTVRFGKDAKVIVERGAKLIVDGGVLTKKECGRDEFWEGVKVHGRRNFPQPTNINGSLDPSRAGVVILRNNARIEFANIGIATEYGLDDINPTLHHNYSGGLINCTNSSFINNKLAVKFTPYSFFNRSKFQGCLFTEPAADDRVRESDGVIITRSREVLFQDCIFNELDNNGITIYDGGANVRSGNTFSELAVPIQVYSSAPSLSNRLIVGKSNVLSSPNGPAPPNIFNGGKPSIDINSTGATYSRIQNNIFNSTDPEGYAIDIEGPSKFLINLNEVNDRPITVSSSGNDYNYIKCNNFTNSTQNHAVQIRGNNNNLKILGNDFNTENGYTLSDNPNNGQAGKIGTNQGSSLYPAHNCFQGQGTDIITLGNTVPFNYYVSNNPDAQCFVPSPGLMNYTLIGTNQNPGNAVHCSVIIKVPDTDLSSLTVFDDSHLAFIYDKISTLSGGGLSPEELSIAIESKEIILDYLLADALSTSDYIRAENLLSQENDIDDQILKYSLKIAEGDFNAAENVLNGIPNSSQDINDFKTIQGINLLRFQNEGTFTLSPVQQETLEGFAEGQDLYRGNARGILGALLNRRFTKKYGEVEEKNELEEHKIELIFKNKLLIYPNPAQDRINIQIPESEEIANELVIYNVTGQVVKTVEVRSPLEVMSLGGFSRGVYFAALKYDTGLTERTKFIVQ